MLSLCLHLSSLNLCHLIAAVFVIIFSLDCFINSFLVYFHIPHVHCLIISFKLVICNLGVETFIGVLYAI